MEKRREEERRGRLMETQGKPGGRQPTTMTMIDGEDGGERRGKMFYSYKKNAANMFIGCSK